MRRKALRRASALCISLITVSLLLTLVPMGGTFAFFDGETVNAGSVFAGGWVTAPTSAATPSTVSGYDATLNWTAGTHGVTGEQILGFDNGTTSNCTGVTYSALTSITATTTYTDSNRGSTANGDWYCYEVLSTNGSWTSPTALTYSAFQLGLAPTAVALTNNNAAIANNDTIVLTFNQKTNVTAGTVKVCAWAGTGTTGSIVIGDTAGNCLAKTDANSIGTLTNIAVGTTRTYLTSTAAVTTTAPWKVTITLAGSSGTSTESGTAKYTASTTIKSNATTDQATVCTAATTNCQPTTTSTF